MLRVLGAAVRGTTRAVTWTRLKPSDCKIPSALNKFDIPAAPFESQARFFSLLCKTSSYRNNVAPKSYEAPAVGPFASSNILKAEAPVARVPARTLIKFTRYKGKRKTARTVLKRFYRLHWGMWIRTKAGRNKRLWKKSAQRKRRLRRHVFTTGSQSHLLDTLVCKYWRRPKFWVDDPYNPYHSREAFPRTMKKPKIPF